MKKILKWVFPALLGIVPVMGADNSYREEANFLEGESGSTVKVIGLRSILVSEKLVDQVRVEREDGRKKYITLKLFDGGITSKNWQYNDETLEAYQQTKVTLILPNDDEINATVTGEKNSYTVKSNKEVTLLNGGPINDTVRPGAIVEVCSQGEYLRPDESLYTINTPLYSALVGIYYNGQHISPKDFLNEAVGTQAEAATFLRVNEEVGEKKETLYPIILKKSVVHSEFIRCYYEFKENCRRGLKTIQKDRHCWEFYDVHKHVTEIFKVVGGQEISLSIIKTETLGATLTHKDGSNPGDKNRDQCSPNGKSYPPGIGGVPLPEDSYAGI